MVLNELGKYGVFPPGIATLFHFLMNVRRATVGVQLALRFVNHMGWYDSAGVGGPHAVHGTANVPHAEPPPAQRGGLEPTTAGVQESSADTAAGQNGGDPNSDRDVVSSG